MKNIIITGGELFNKGAQSMLFITIDSIRKLFPSHQVLVMSPMDAARPLSERKKYNFKFVNWYPPKFALSQHNPILRLIYKIIHRDEYTNVNQFIEIAML